MILPEFTPWIALIIIGFILKPTNDLQVLVMVAHVHRAFANEEDMAHNATFSFFLSLHAHQAGPVLSCYTFESVWFLSCMRSFVVWSPVMCEHMKSSQFSNWKTIFISQYFPNVLQICVSVSRVFPKFTRVVPFVKQSLPHVHRPSMKPSLW